MADVTPARWALREGVASPEDDAETRFRLSTQELGVLAIPSGRLLVGDRHAVFRVPPGEVRVVATHAQPLDGDEPVLAYVSFLVAGRTEVRRGTLREAHVAEPRSARHVAVGPERFGCGDGRLYALDAQAARTLACGWARPHGPDDLEPLAEIAPALKDRPDSPPAVICSCGDGDFDVAAGYTARGDLAALHVDFGWLQARRPADEGSRRTRQDRWWAGPLFVLVIGLAGILLAALLARGHGRDAGRHVVVRDRTSPETRPR